MHCYTLQLVTHILTSDSGGNGLSIRADFCSKNQHIYSLFEEVAIVAV